MDEWNTKICIIDMRDDLQPEISGWLFQSQLAGAVVRRPHYRPDSLLVFVSVQLCSSLISKRAHGRAHTSDNGTTKQCNL